MFDLRRSKTEQILKMLSCEVCMIAYQVLFCKALWTEIFFFLEILKMSDAKSRGRCPCSKALFEKEVLLPSPNKMDVATPNRNLSVELQGVFEPTHTLSS